MKRSSIISLCLLIAAAVGLTVLFIVLKNRENKPAEPGKEEFFTVKTIAAESVDKLVLNSYAYSGTFVREGDTWYHETDLLNQAVIAQFPDSLLSNLRAIAKVDNPAADSEYGLETPSAVLEAFAGDSRLVKIELGDKVPTKNCYYCRFDDEKTVYTVSDNFARILLKDQAYYTRAVTLPVIDSIKSITEVTVTGTLFPEFHAVKNKDNPYDYSGSGMFPWYFTTPYRAQWEADIINGNWMDQLEYYLSIHPESMKTLRPEEFAEYGLNDPQASLTVAYTNGAGTESGSYTLLIGNRQEETGTYYARFTGLDVLLELSSFKVAMMCDVDVFGNTYHPVFYPSIRTFSKVTVRAGETVMVFTGGKENGEDVYRLNGRQIENSEALAWAQNIISLKTSAFRPCETPQTEPILTIEVEVADKTKFSDMTIRIFRGEDGSDIVERLGVCDCRIDSRTVDEFIKTMSGK